MYVLVATMKLYSLTVMYKGLDGKVKKLCGASDLASFGYFQRSRLVAFAQPLYLTALLLLIPFICIYTRNFVLKCKVGFYYNYYYNHSFYGSLDFVWDNPGEPVPEGTFCHLLDFLVQNEDNRQMHQQSGWTATPSRLIGAPPLPSHHFYAGCPS